MMTGDETRARGAVTVRQMAAPHEVETFCANCGKVVLTVVEYEPGTCTYLHHVTIVLGLTCVDYLAHPGEWLTVLPAPTCPA